ncbi:MAG: ClpXP protease specificity-enhancing factor [Gammaproteobacteria bacterium]
MNSQRPYLVRAIHEWICDNGETPVILVDVSHPGVRVPGAFVNDGRIVLNVSPQATDGLDIGNDKIAFSARFGGLPETVELPVAAVLAVYSRESQHGMLFAVGEDGEIASSGLDDDDGPDDDGPGGAPRDRSHLRVIK